MPLKRPVLGLKTPMAAQVMVLVVAGLLAAPMASLLVIFTSEPSHPAVYTLDEIAAALNGGPLATRSGSTLLREEASPPLNRTAGLQASRGHRALALLLGVAPERVRLWEQGADGGLDGQARHLDGLERNADGMGEARIKPRAIQGAGEALTPVTTPVAFAAALETAPGRWTVVRSPPEPLLNAWQVRVGFWLLACVLALATLAYGFARRITAPLQAFAAAAQALGRDPTAPLVPLEGPAEIGQAAHAFNDMAARIRRHLEDRTAMVSAISHDLRTPLARIQFHIEAEQPNMAAIRANLTQIDEMISSVLAFFRDSSAASPRRRFDLLSVLEVIVDNAAMMGQDAKIEPQETVCEVVVEGDLEAIRRMLTNLVDNALKYGGQARLGLSQRRNLAIVDITDRGPGIAPAELSRVFEPFYRPSASRTLDTRGVGLGLSIARSIAVAHGGDVCLTNLPDGFRARVQLPLAAARPTPDQAWGARELFASGLNHAQPGGALDHRLDP